MAMPRLSGVYHHQHGLARRRTTSGYVPARKQACCPASRRLPFVHRHRSKCGNRAAFRRRRHRDQPRPLHAASAMLASAPRMCTVSPLGLSSTGCRTRRIAVQAARQLAAPVLSTLHTARAVVGDGVSPAPLLRWRRAGVRMALPPTSPTRPSAEHPRHAVHANSCQQLCTCAGQPVDSTWLSPMCWVTRQAAGRGSSSAQRQRAVLRRLCAEERRRGRPLRLPTMTRSPRPARTGRCSWCAGGGGAPSTVTVMSCSARVFDEQY